MMKYLLFLALPLLLVACGDADQAAAEQAAQEAAEAAQNSLYQTMMEGHDRVMPMMGQVNQLQRNLQQRMEDTGLAEDHRELLTAANEKLEDAHDGMMEWMNGVKPLDELRGSMSADGVTDYIKEQTRSIGEVETAIVSSVASAQELLGMDGHDHDHGDGHDHDHDH